MLIQINKSKCDIFSPVILAITLCVLGSDHSTPRTGRPKRPTWDMSTPKGELLNQPGVGFIVAEQAQVGCVKPWLLKLVTVG